MSSRQIGVCSLEACEKKDKLKLCSACKLVAYCCSEHQIQSWPTHKLNCKKNTSLQQQQIKLLCQAIDTRDNVEPVKKYIREGYDISMKNKNGFTALTYAIGRNRKKCVQALIDAKANVDQTVTGGVSPVYLATERKNTASLKLLIAAKANVNLAESNDGATASIRAAQDNNTEGLKLLIKAQADLNITGKRGATALYIATQQKNVSCVQLLISSQADVNIPEINGATPMFIAAHMDSPTPVKLLIKAKADLNIAENKGVTPVFRAAEQDNKTSLKLLLDAKADFDKPRKDDVTPLMMASHKGNIDCVNMLVERKADINAETGAFPEIGTTALEIAAQAGHDDIVAILQGAEITKPKQKKPAAEPCACRMCR